MPRQTVGRRKEITIYDVAAQSGVSYQTVSRVINNMPDVAPKTRLRILSVMEDLGYRPNMTARHLVSQRSTVIGFVTWATGFYGPAQIMINVERAAREADYSLMFAGIREASIDRIRRAVNKLCSHRVAGILMHLPFQMDLRLLRDVCSNVPLVAVDCDLGFEAPSVHFGQEHGSYLATKYLLDLGHTQIAYLRGPMVWRVAGLRYQGWLNAVQEAGLSPGPCVDGNWTSRGGYQATLELIKDYWKQFTALAVANDQMALGAIQAFAENRIRVPDDVSIVGFDDLPEAEFFRPPLSTIKHDFASIGSLSIRCFMDQLSEDYTASPVYKIEPTFVARQSTAPPKR
jgi:DNA-binding LacI/PurR family transcriptional regulator